MLLGAENALLTKVKADIVYKAGLSSTTLHANDLVYGVSFHLHFSYMSGCKQVPISVNHMASGRY